VSFLIEIKNISKHYRGATLPSVHNFSLTICNGSFVALLGESGSGKTTVLKSINRLIETDYGSIEINGQLTSKSDAYSLRRGIGYVFQGSGLFPHLTIAKNISVTPELLGWERPAIDHRVSELLELVSLPLELSSRLPHQLSGGQQQRVALARALAAIPPIVLMDEPFGALDPFTRDKLGTDYLQLHKHLKLTTVMVTHDIQEALLLADRIVVMKQGQIIADFLPVEVGNQTSLEVLQMVKIAFRHPKSIQMLV
jgi:osmoprotectant transport system ATP-binding protein